MADQLITRYRPDKFKNVYGHEAIINSLQAHISRRDANCYLFVGENGLGKTTLAKITAQELGCEEIFEVDAATKTGVDDMRDITENLSYPPLGGGNRAIILDECHMLSANAWNSLLINLENPKPFNFWFPCTTQVSKVPKGVRQRCAEYLLTQLTQDDLTCLLDDIVHAEKMKPIKGAVAACVYAAKGSARQAISNLGKVHACKSMDEVDDLLGTVESATEGIDIARALIGGKGWKDLLPLLNKLEASKIESVRHVVLAYVSKVVLGNGITALNRAVLHAFSTPFASNEGMAPLLIAIDKVVGRS